MPLTKEIHTKILRMTLDFCDKGEREFREFIGGRLNDDFPDGDAQEWVDSMYSMWGCAFIAEDPVCALWKYLKFYHDQSVNTVTPRSNDWTTKDWNEAANEIYRWKFLGSGDHVDELIARFNAQEPRPKEKKFIPAHDSALQALDVEEFPSGNGVCMSLRGFIQRYGEELEDYYDEDFGTGDICDDVGGDSMIMCLVDNGKDHLPEEIKKKIRKAGKFRRDKLKHQWSYVNPLNRIHGYVNLVHVKQKNNFIPKDKKVLSVSVVCASHFSKKKGVGSDLMKMSEEFAKLSGYSDIILEVANEYAGYAEEEEEEEEEESESEEEEEEEDERWFPDENVIDILADEFWKKCMRKDKEGKKDIVSYNLEKDYLESCLCSYLYYDSEQFMDKEKTVVVEPGEYDYWGFWYKKGKQSKIRLMKFYEKMGYKEDPSVHLDWNCFTETPYPSMRFELH
jgi:hypothetical protein